VNRARARLVMTGAALAFVSLASLACNLFKHEPLSFNDCKPRKLTRMSTCHGENSGFQECRFYFRATGTPDRAWCEALLAIPLATGQPPSVCEPSVAATWQHASCADYNIAGPAHCFLCPGTQGEARTTYLYAYSADCTQALEQVTCNYDPQQAASRLGRAAL
jgi:hypothetical protein